MTRFAQFIAVSKKILIGSLVAFLVYHGGRIFLIEATRISPADGAEVFVSNFPVSMAIIFLPRYEIITIVKYDSETCVQLLDQTNRVGRKVVGDFYYLEDPNAIIDLFPFVPSPKGYEPCLYEMEVISTLGQGKNCDDALLPIGTKIEVIMHHKGDRLITDRYKGELFDRQIYYPDSHIDFFREEMPNLSSVSGLYLALKSQQE